MKFQKLFQLLCESFDFNYDLPEDKEFLLFDFYTLNFISKAPDNTLNRNYLQFRTETEDFYKAVGETEQKLLPFLKKELLEAVFASICFELRHVFDKRNDYSFSSSNQSVLISKTFIAALTEKENEWLEIFINKLNNAEVTAEFIDKTNKLSEKINRIKAYLAFEQSKISKKRFVEIAKKLYNLESLWRPGFAGKVWANICTGWLKLNSISDSNISELYIWIDHIYDLQHNNNYVLDKITSYNKTFVEYFIVYDRNYYTNENYTNKKISENTKSINWLNDALSLKKDIRDPWVLVDRCSDNMKKLASRVLHLKGYGSFEQSIETVEKINQNIQLEKVKANPNNIRFIQNPTEEMQIIAVKKEPVLICRIMNPTETVQKIAIDLNGEALRYILNPTESVKRIAIRNSESAFEYIKNPSEELQKLAVSLYPENIKYIKNPSKEIQLLAVSKHPESIFNIKSAVFPEVQELFRKLTNSKTHISSEEFDKSQQLTSKESARFKNNEL